MSKLIIRNESKLSDPIAMQRVLTVIEEGRVSGLDLDSYCYLTMWSDGVRVSARRNKASDTFVVWSEE